MKFQIIIPFYKNYDSIERLLMSVKDQDYKNINTTVVVDGEDNNAGKLLSTLKKTYEFDLHILKKNKGASHARNYGANICRKDGEDDILFFVDADCQLYPGVISDFQTNFELFPDVDFLYGNYRFDDTSGHLANNYEPHLLETMNYICTMSPVKRSAFESVDGFPEDRKYFQDWGLFYKLSKEGFKGRYLGKNFFVFKTSKPTEENISGTQGMSLSEKAKEFREYYGIKHKELVVSTWGAPLQAIQRAKMLNADYAGIANGSDKVVQPVNYMFDNWKATYMVGCYNSTISALNNHLESIVGKPIIHFIGTDTFELMNKHSKAALNDIKRMFDLKGAKLFANSPRGVEELQSCGLDAELLYTPVYNMDQYKPKFKLPNKFTVGVYISSSNPMHRPDGANGDSNIPLILDVADSLPHIDFKLFGADNIVEQKGNLEYCGRIPESEMVDFINECSMVVRATIHDGFPQLPIQFLLCGRQALVSCPDEMKYCDKLSFEDIMHYGDAKDEMLSKIIEMSNKKYDYDKLAKNAKDHYSDLMSEEYFKKRVYDEI